jgi:hypothetical protein
VCVSIRNELYFGGILVRRFRFHDDGLFIDLLTRAPHNEVYPSKPAFRLSKVKIVLFSVPFLFIIYTSTLFLPHYVCQIQTVSNHHLFLITDT